MALLGKGRKKNKNDEVDIADIEQANEELEAEEAQPARKRGGLFSKLSRKKSEVVDTPDGEEDDDDDDDAPVGLPVGAAANPAPALAPAGSEPLNLNLPAEPEAPKAEADAAFNLKDIFEEASAVDENLQRLAESVDEVTAEDLADDLRNLLDELEEMMEPAGR